MPISASSPAACTSVERIAVPDGGSGLREGGAGGVPAGCLGWGRARLGPPPAGPFAAREAGRGRARGIVPGSFELDLFSLRRCGRLRGRPPRMSEGWSSLIAAESLRTGAYGRCFLDERSTSRLRKPNLRVIERAQLETSRVVLRIAGGDFCHAGEPALTLQNVVPTLAVIWRACALRGAAPAVDPRRQHRTAAGARRWRLN
jgi:hypothetical protein